MVDRSMTKKYALVGVSVVVVITLVLTAILLGVYFYTKEVENVLEVGAPLAVHVSSLLKFYTKRLKLHVRSACNYFQLY